MNSTSPVQKGMVAAIIIAVLAIAVAVQMGYLGGINSAENCTISPLASSKDC